MRWTLCLTALCATGVQAQGPRVEVRANAAVLSTERTVFASGLVDRSRGTMTGFEFLARGEPLGIQLRLLRGAFDGSLSGGDLRQAEATLLVGAPEFHVAAGYGRRARGSSLTSGFLGYGRVGAKSILTLGSSGVAVELSAVALLSPVGETEKTLTSVGREGEVALIYQLPRGLPLHTTLGYRYQWFKNQGRAGSSREESSSLVLGVGLR
ncbi:MAG: hypothetical protein ACRENB_09240, partial [Gemmatimonadales bacterium]